MPLECEQIRNEFSALLDDELNSEDRELVEEHLSDCSDCLRELHGYQQVSDAYRYHHPVKAPADFEALFRERMAPGVRRRGLPARTWVSLAAAAGVTLVAGVVLWQKPLPEQTVFQLSRNEAEGAPLAQEAASARQDRDAAADGAREMTEEPQMSAFRAAPAPEPSTPAAEAPSGGIGATALQEDLQAPAEPMVGGGAPQMKRFEIADDTAAPPASDESALAPRSAPLDLETDGEPVHLGRARAMNPAPAAAESGVAAEEAPEPTRERADSPSLDENAPEGVSAAGAALARQDGDGVLRWRERTFQLRDGTWRQEGYAGESATGVLIPSGDWNTLLDAHPDLNKLVSPDAPVIVKLGEIWYEFRQAETPPEDEAGQGR